VGLCGLSQQSAGEEKDKQYAIVQR